MDVTLQDARNLAQLALQHAVDAYVEMLDAWEHDDETAFVAARTDALKAVDLVRGVQLELGELAKEGIERP